MYGFRLLSTTLIEQKSKQMAIDDRPEAIFKQNISQRFPENHVIFNVHGKDLLIPPDFQANLTMP